MTVLLRSGVLRLCAGSAAFLAFTSAPVAAQRGGPCTQPSTILVAWPVADTKANALQVRDRVWSTLKDFPKGWCVLGKDQVEGWLNGSNFPTDSVLSTRDWIQLGNMLRADEVLELSAKPVGRGDFEISGRITLVRDANLRDSIPKVDLGGSLSITAKNLNESLKKVRAQFPHEEKCYSFGREGKYAEAEAAGRAALAAYPGNIARLCLATALFEGKKNPEEVIALSEEVRKTDPKNGLAQLHLLNTYLAQNNNAKYAEIATAILQADPAHPDAETIITNLAAQKQTEVVSKLLETALESDPDNTGLRRLEFRVVFASDNLKEIEKKGEAIAKLDTAFVDTLFIQRMASTYARDSIPNKQLEKVGEWYSRGAQKFPQNLTMAMALAQTLKALNQPEEAIKEYKRVLEINPKAPQVRLYIADTYERSGQPDSAYAWIRKAAETPEDRNHAAALVLAQGLRKLNAAQTSRSIDDWRASIPVLAYADSLNSEDRQANFWWGVASFQVGYLLYQQISAPGAAATCETAKEIKDLLLQSNERVRSAPNTNAQVAGQILTGFGQLLPAIDDVLTRLKC